MKTKLIFLFLLSGLSSQLCAQSLNNVYEDAKSLKGLMNAGTLDPGRSKEWLTILHKYTSVTDASDYDGIVGSFDNNPFNLKKAGLIPATPTGANALIANDYHQMINERFKLKVQKMIEYGPGSTTNTPDPAAPNITTASVAYALTDLIIARGKEELSATFFERLKIQIQKNPELQIAFPKTTKFIGQIESYLYASYLSTLRQAFADDINNIPFNIGAILRSARMKSYIDKNPKSKDVWFVTPVMTALGDLRSGKSLSMAIKDLYPDPELKDFNVNYYNILKIVVSLSESVRDVTGKKEWVDFATIHSFLADPVSAKLFFGLLYEETKYLNPAKTDFMSNYIVPGKESDLESLIESFSTGYTDTKSAIKAIKDATASGSGLDVS